ncbi:scaffolding protein [Erwinia sp. P6884]|uniref:scaffolding protein n=1 Tax=Erwinia sp. P6884 TaxID=3141450 RepID=UPI0031990445
MSDTTEIQTAEEPTLPGDQTAASVESQVDGNATDTEGRDEGFDVVLNDDETTQKQDHETNAKHAARRIARKRQRELEQQMEAVQRGELPENLRVSPELPKQPDVNEYLSDEALAKFDYDTNRALAAFNSANTEWQMKAMDARSNAVAEQGRKTQDYTRQSTQHVEAARKHYDAAEKLNLPDYQDKEDAFRELVPAGVDVAIMNLFPEKSAPMIYHLGSNPEKVRQLMSMNEQQVIIELTRLSDRLTLKPRGKSVSAAPPVDEPVQGSVVAANIASLQKKMEAAAAKGDTETYRKLKAQIQGIK